MYVSAPRTCEQCGKTLVPKVYPSGAKDRPSTVARRRFCSKACVGQAKVVHPEYDPKERARNIQLLNRYSISLEEYRYVLAQQGGGCYVCGRPPKTRALHVDHNHKTGVVRAIVCWACNSAIRNVRDDPAYARKLAELLEEPHPIERVLGRRVVGMVGPTTKHKKRKNYAS